MYTMKLPAKRSVRSRILGVVCLVVVFYFGYNTLLADVSLLSQEEDFGKHPVIFVGGYKRSGTTLMRSIIESHPDVYCGPETLVLMKVINEVQDIENHMKKPKFGKIALNTGLKNATLRNALTRFMETVIKDRSPKVNRYCTKDPYNANFIELFKQMYPNMKFVLMIRDVRGVFNSYVNRIHNFNMTSYKRIFNEWNTQVKHFVKQCLRVGPDYCIIQPYEHLIQNRTYVIKKVAKFLNLEWHENMLNHEKFVGDRIKLSPTEWSTSQVKKPIYDDAIHAWVGRLPKEVLDEVPKLVPMMARLGYDPYANNSYNRMPL